MNIAHLLTTALLAFQAATPAAPAPAAAKPATPAAATPAQSIPWETAFHDSSGNTPIHFTAHYVDAHGQPHALEEWRIGQRALRRKTDDRIDLYATADSTATGTQQPLTYTWQIVDLHTRIDHRISTAGMLHLGMLYSFYGMAHLLTRPTGSFRVVRAAAPATAATPPTTTRTPSAAALHQPLQTSAARQQPCTWFQISAAGQPSSRVCWLARYGIAASIDAQGPQGWHRTFQVDTLRTGPIPPKTFLPNTAGLQVRDVDELEAED